MKRFIVFLLFFSAALAVETINSVSDFVTIANKAAAATSVFDFDIQLNIDLDFSNSQLASVKDKLPLGRKAGGYNAYSGTFEGNGHTVKNLVLNGGYSYNTVGLMCAVVGGTIKNLVIDKSCSFSGQTVGGIASYAGGSVSVQNVKVNAVLSSESTCGGIFSQSSGTSYIDIVDSEFGGSVTTSSDSHFAGGFLAVIGSEGSTLNVERCKANFVLKSVSDGYFGGILGAFQANKGSVTMKNNNIMLNAVFTKPSSSEYYANIGGYIGFAKGSNQQVNLENNINGGKISAETNSETNIGGFVGRITSEKSTLSMTSNKNNADLISVSSSSSGGVYMGGLIGQSFTLDSQTVTLLGNTNRGWVNSSGVCGNFYSSGVLAFINSMYAQPVVTSRISSNKNEGNIFFNMQSSYEVAVGGILGASGGEGVTVSLSENTNKGFIKGTVASGSIGGIVGDMHTKIIMKTSGAFNYGDIDVKCLNSGSCDVGGIIAEVASNSGSVSVQDSENFGSLKSTSRVCGIVCGSNQISVDNVVNKGSLEGNSAFGIVYASLSASGTNVVSMGDVKGKSASYQFWSNGRSNNNVFGMKDNCVNCNGITFFEMDSTGYYYPVGGSSRVDETLNTLAARYGYKTWDRYLNLATPKNIHIHIGDPVNYDKDAIAGNPLQECGVSSEAFKYHFFAKGATPSVSNEYKKTTIINDDVDLVPYFMIEINSGLNGTYFVEATGSKTLEQCGLPSELFNYHLFVKGSNPTASNEYKKDHVVTESLDLVAYHQITINGKTRSNSVLSGTYYCEAFGGKTLGQCGIPDEVFEYHLFNKGTTPSSANEYKKESLIEHDVNLVAYYMITVKGVLTGVYYVEAENNKLVDVQALKQYLQSKNYAVGDSELNEILSIQSFVTGDMVIVVMKRNSVAIELNSTLSVLASEVNISELSNTISNLTEVDVSDILIELESDEQGYVKKVKVVLNDVDKCNELISAVNTEDLCELSPVLCNSHAQAEENSSSASPSSTTHASVSLSARNYLQSGLIVGMLLFIVGSM